MVPHAFNLSLVTLVRIFPVQGLFEVCMFFSIHANFITANFNIGNSICQFHDDCLSVLSNAGICLLMPPFSVSTLGLCDGSNTICDDRSKERTNLFIRRLSVFQCIMEPPHRQYLLIVVKPKFLQG